MLRVSIDLQLLLKFFLCVFFFFVYLVNPLSVLAFDTSDPSVSLLQNMISNNFSRKYCKAIQNDFSKDEAMKSAIVKTENIISFSYNPQKKWIEKDDLASQISLQVVNDCGWTFGLIGKEGVDYFKSYFLEIYEKTTPDNNFSRQINFMNNISDKLVMTIILITILFVFGLIFSVKSPQRKVIDSPIMWKDDYTNISIFRSYEKISKLERII